MTDNLSTESFLPHTSECSDNISIIRGSPNDIIVRFRQYIDNLRNVCICALNLCRPTLCIYEYV